MADAAAGRGDAAGDSWCEGFLISTTWGETLVNGMRESSDDGLAQARSGDAICVASAPGGSTLAARPPLLVPALLSLLSCLKQFSGA